MMKFLNCEKRKRKNLNDAKLTSIHKKLCVGIRISAHINKQQACRHVRVVLKYLFLS